MPQQTWNLGDFAGSRGYFVRGEWTVDRDMLSLAVGKIVAIEPIGVTLEFAAGNQVTLGEGLLHRPEQWEIDSWHRMRRESV